MAATLQSRIQSLGQKLEAENESRRKEYQEQEKERISGRPKPLKLPELRINPRKQRPDKLSFDLNAPPISPRRRQAAGPPIQLSAENSEDDGSQIENKLQEITKQTGFLKVGDEKIKFAIDDLETVDEIGSGTCGQVIKMRHKDAGAIFAVKRMRRSYNKEEQKRILMDLEVVMKSHDCPFIVNCIGSYISKSDVFICMELMSTCLDKLLKKLCGPIPENILGKMTVAIVNALNYLKETHGIMHRDVKPSNILLDDNGCVKLCDFGISGRLVDSKAKTRSAGCAAYMAPERIAPPDPVHPDYDVRADVWSLGISLVELATGEFPYKNCSSEFEVLSSVMNEASPSLPADETFSEAFRDFVNICLIKDYKERPKYNKLLEHPFIKRYEEEPVDVAGWLSEVSESRTVMSPTGLLETEL